METPATSCKEAQEKPIPVGRALEESRIIRPQAVLAMGIPVTLVAFIRLPKTFGSEVFGRVFGVFSLISLFAPAIPGHLLCRAAKKQY